MSAILAPKPRLITKAMTCLAPKVRKSAESARREVDHQAQRALEQERSVAGAGREAEAPLHDALEVLHLLRLEQHRVAGLEVDRAGVLRVVVGTVHRDQQARRALEHHRPAARALREIRVALLGDLDVLRQA